MNQRARPAGARSLRKAMSHSPLLATFSNRGRHSGPLAISAIPIAVWADSRMRTVGLMRSASGILSSLGQRIWKALRKSVSGSSLSMRRDCHDRHVPLRQQCVTVDPHHNDRGRYRAGERNARRPTSRSNACTSCRSRRGTGRCAPGFAGLAPVAALRLVACGGTGRGAE